MERKIIQPAGLVQPSTPYSQVVQANCSSFLFIAGQTGVDSQGNTLGSTIGEQMDQIFANLLIALEAANADFSNVVKFNSIVKIGHVESYTQKRLELFPRIYPNSDYPTNSIIIVPELPSPEWFVEVEAIAALPSNK